MKGLKVNLHITERCNYRCKYCFAHFGKKNDLSLEQWQRIVDNLKSSGLVSAINFAGGEPMLYKNFPALLSYAKDSGFCLSLISNGSLLLNEKITPTDTFEKLDTLGISVDSFDEKILVALGCCNSSLKVLSKEELIRVINRARSVNPAIKIKLNSVISKLNVNERLTSLEDKVSIDRWKFLKIKLFETENFSNRDLVVREDEFRHFIERNPRNGGEAVLEPELTRSYIIIDNGGNLLDDFGEDYSVVGNLLEESFTEVFGRYNFDKTLYQNRYKLGA